jgi:hypothetical protein
MKTEAIKKYNWKDRKREIQEMFLEEKYILRVPLLFILFNLRSCRKSQA